MTVAMDPYRRANYRRGPVVNREPSVRRNAHHNARHDAMPKLPKERPSNRARRIFRRVLFATSLLLTLIIVGVGLGFWLLWSSLPLPPDHVPIQSSQILDDTGKYQLAVINSGENRTPVALRDVPKVVTDAVISTEDRHFYTHHGVDPVGITRALINDLRGGHLQGGSTISQQYVKQAYVGQKRTATRKVKEAVLAVKLEQRYSKDQILERYLNIIYMGRSSYGIQTASNAYFGKDIKDCTVKEAAYLAGIIRGPELADAYKAPDEANRRRAFTLSAMVRDGHITQAQADEVQATKLQSYVLKRAPAIVQAKADAPGTEYFTEYVKAELVKKYGEKRVDAGGLKVKTTLDLANQRQAYSAVYGMLDREDDPAGALVSIDKNGYIVAMVGGKDFGKSRVNLATGLAGGGSGRHAGSTFKPLELAAVLERGACLRDTYAGPPEIELPGWDSDPNKPQVVTNYDDESFRKLTLLDATVHSVNTVYAQLVMKDKPRNLINVAKRVGVTSPMRENNSLVLGAVDVSPLEMADAYLTFGLGGMRVTPNAILEVRSSDGSVIEKATPQRSRQIDQEVAASVNHALQKVVTDGTGKNARIGVDVAGKTGTTEDYGDAWFVGYTPQLATAVWVGFPEGSAHKMTNIRGIDVTGGTFPAQIFSTYMRQAVAGMPDSRFTPPRDCDGTDYSNDVEVPNASGDNKNSDNNGKKGRNNDGRSSSNNNWFTDNTTVTTSPDGEDLSGIGGRPRTSSTTPSRTPTLQDFYR